MKILKNAGKHEIIDLPEDVIGKIASAARTCKQSQNKSTPEADLKLVKKILKRKESSMLEFADMTVRITDISIGLTRELRTHRLASPVEYSTRSGKMDELAFVVPPHKDETQRYEVPGFGYYSLQEYFALSEAFYYALRDNEWKPEDARQALPIGTKTEYVEKANLREWRHIFKMRTARGAHWEIRRVLCNLLAEVQDKIPLIFDDFVPVYSDGKIVSFKIGS